MIHNEKHKQYIVQLLSRERLVDFQLSNLQKSLECLDDLLSDMEVNREAIRDCDHDNLEKAISHVCAAARHRALSLLKEVCERASE